MPPIVFFGTEEHSLITLKALYNANLPVTAVITKPDAPRGRGGKMTEPAVKTFAREHNITVWQPAKLKDVANSIKQLNNPVGVLVSYGKIIPQSIIDLFSPGIINVHPSLLPKYRGPSPIEAAMTNLDTETGVSIMQLDADMDAGPIYHQEKITLTGHESRTELYNQLFVLGSEKLIELLPRVVSGDLQPVEQNHAEATYCTLLSKKDALLDPAKLTAAQAEARVRAHLSFPRTKLAFDDLELIITAAHVANKPHTALDQQFTDGNHLIVDQLITPTSGKQMTAEAFLRGRQG